jgi:organic radical activating enzyme
MEHTIKNGYLLPVVESFNTLQGEGFHAGVAAFFIRLGGCDIGCHWCDTKESWDAETHPQMKVEEIASILKKSNTKVAVITGGEPVMYNLGPITKSIKQLGVKTHIETSGAYPLTGSWDWVCLSPKKNAPPVKSIYKKTNELKIIIHNHDDFNWAETNAKKVEKECKLYLQPEWGKSKKMIMEIKNYIEKYPNWRLSLQTHKYLGIP